MNAGNWKVALASAVAVLSASLSIAQPDILTAEQVQQRITGGTKVVVVDVRTSEEYKQGHIPGAIHLPADRIAAERTRLPKDRSAEIIFYCRGVG